MARHEWVGFIPLECCFEKGEKEEKDVDRMTERERGGERLIERERERERD